MATPVKASEPKMIKSPTRKAASVPKKQNTQTLKPSLIIPSKKEETKVTPVPVVKTQKTAQKTQEETEQEVKFKVLLEVTDRLADTKKAKWTSLHYSIQVVKENNSFKYLAIGFKSYEEAANAKNQLRKSGFKEAFVVAYQNGNRIKIEKALKQSSH